MQNTIIHHEGAASLEVVVSKIKPSAAVIKVGLDVHARIYVAVAQYDHLLSKAARRFAPKEFVPWVEGIAALGPHRARGLRSLRIRVWPLPSTGSNRCSLLRHCAAQTRRT